MKKLLNILFSPRTTLGLLVIFAIAMAAATFIENSYDTITAKIVVYNAIWFEAVMVLMIINFIGSIKRYQFLTWKKTPGFIFHCAFILMIIGAGVTRYVGFEGRMHIREGAISNFIFSNQTFLNIRTSDGTLNYSLDRPVSISQITNNSFEVPIKTATKGTIEIRYKDHLVNAQETYAEGQEGGFTMLALTISVDGHKDEIQLKDGELQMNHNFPITFNNNQHPGALKITGNADQLFISYSGNIKTTALPAKTEGLILRDSLGTFSSMHLYQPEGTGISVELSKISKNTHVKYISGTSDQNGPDALILDVNYNGKKKEVAVTGGAGYLEKYVDVPLEGLDLKLAYGVKKNYASFCFTTSQI